MTRAPELDALTDDVLRHELLDWSLYVRDENGDLTPAQWATIDALLDELGRRLAGPANPAARR
jgi:hypothetical protein